MYLCLVTHGRPAEQVVKSAAGQTALDGHAQVRWLGE